MEIGKIPAPYLHCVYQLNGGSGFS